MSDILIRADEQSVISADGEVLREYDDVVLLRSAKPSGSGNAAVDVVEAGTTGTIITILDHDRVEIECYVESNRFAFAQEEATQLRLVRRREEKLKHA
jgi:hypothetical protein